MVMSFKLELDILVLELAQIGQVIIQAMLMYIGTGGDFSGLSTLTWDGVVG